VLQIDCGKASEQLDALKQQTMAFALNNGMILLF